jgi:hypothetical protein
VREGPLLRPCVTHREGPGRRARRAAKRQGVNGTGSTARLCKNAASPLCSSLALAPSGPSKALPSAGRRGALPGGGHFLTGIRGSVLGRAEMLLRVSETKGRYGRRGLESADDARAQARKARQRWQRFSVSCTTILLRGIRARTLGTRFPGSSATTAVRRRRPPSGSTSSRGARAAAVPRGTGPRVCCHVGQGWVGLGLRARAPGRCDRHLAAVLARLPDG